MSFYTVKPESLLLSVRVTPNARREGIEGLWNDTHLKIALTAPAVDGKANEALIAFLAPYLQVRKTDITLLSGQTARYKILKITSVHPDALIPLIKKQIDKNC